MFERLITWFMAWGVPEPFAAVLARSTGIVVVLLLAVLANLVTRRLILRGLTHVISRTRTKWDDALIERKVLDQIAHLAPALVVYLLAPLVLQGVEGLLPVVNSAVLIYIIIVAVLAIDAFLNATVDIYNTLEISRKIPIRNFVQFIKIAIYFVAAILVIAIILNKTPLYLLSGLGALTAVLILVFKDPILGFVAGIQLTANKMLAPGDWIEMPRYGADGEVMELTLTTVKVRNWDKTITTVPTYALITESFKNWRGMEESGGRRIKRAVNIDMNTIKFCDEEMIRRFSKIQYIAAYVEKKKKELAEFNKMLKVDLSSLANGRRMTNVGTFRAYVTAYLQNHPMINQEMTLMVRQLSPGPCGLPLEIYAFCKDKAWVNYERIQADIFDHILAVLPEFDLRVFQEPTGQDLRAWKMERAA